MDGTEREIDKLGRVVIPIKIRKKLNIESEAKVLVYLEGNHVVISPMELHCALCGNKITKNRNIRLCDNCILKIPAKD